MALTNLNFTEDLCLTKNRARKPLALVTITDGTNPIDITGWSWAASIKNKTTGVIAGSFTITVTNAPLGQLELSLENTALSTATPGRDFFYDLVGTDTLGDQRNYLRGLVWIVDNATEV